MAHEIIHEIAYLYYVKDGEFKCDAGKINHYGDDISSGYHFSGLDKKLIEVPRRPGKLHKGIMWLEKRGDKRARRIFREQCEEHIDIHEQNIEVLRKYIQATEGF